MKSYGVPVTGYGLRATLEAERRKGLSTGKGALRSTAKTAITLRRGGKLRTLSALVARGDGTNERTAISVLLLAVYRK